MPRDKITVVVKGGPAINDALRADATVAGLDGWVAVTDTGCDGAGIQLEACSPEFRRRFARADLIIAKGQANFESLDGSGQNIIFLFKVKCVVMGQYIGQPVHTWSCTAMFPRRRNWRSPNPLSPHLRAALRRSGRGQAEKQFLSILIRRERDFKKLKHISLRVCFHRVLILAVGLHPIGMTLIDLMA